MTRSSSRLRTFGESPASPDITASMAWAISSPRASLVRWPGEHVADLAGDPGPLGRRGRTGFRLPRGPLLGEEPTRAAPGLGIEPQ
ncbi:hypothetical protein [Streptomyces sp. SM10]|uniref:hypothetical protein n=1 Tax=Streptomyces sp. SM10 TaxID=565556 RepID=UPI0027E45EBA|nr:hypothetical protein [Streptomyces sp. SM10]